MHGNTSTVTVRHPSSNSSAAEPPMVRLPGFAARRGGFSLQNRLFLRAGT